MVTSTNIYISTDPTVPASSAIKHKKVSWLHIIVLSELAVSVVPVDVLSSGPGQLVSSTHIILLTQLAWSVVPVALHLTAPGTYCPGQLRQFMSAKLWARSAGQLN